MSTGDDQRQDRDFLFQIAVWQDSLLQSYRTLHITRQSILIAIGAGLVIGTASLELPSRQALESCDLSGISRLILPEVASLAALAFLLMLGTSQRKQTDEMREVIKARGQDINGVHSSIIFAERKLTPDQRLFTKFKIDQQRSRGLRPPAPANSADDADDRIRVLSNDFLQENPSGDPGLLVGSKGPTRRKIDDHILDWMKRVWVWLMVCLLVVVINRLVLLLPSLLSLPCLRPG